MSNELKITKDRVLSAAEKCPTAKETLKELFPDAFENDAFYFGEEHKITTCFDGPLVIGKALAPDGLSMRCLIVNGGYNMQVVMHGSRQILIFREKP